MAPPSIPKPIGRTQVSVLHLCSWLPCLALAAWSSATRALHLDFRNTLGALGPPSLLLFRVLPIGCLRHLRTEEVKGVSKRRPPQTPQSMWLSQSPRTREAQELPVFHVAICHTCMLAGPEPWRSMNLTHLSCIYTLLFTRKTNYSLRAV